MDSRFALLLACFFLSGFAALLYQTVWTRELSFVFGTSALAVAAVLGAYMGGLALGAAAAARYAMRLRMPESGADPLVLDALGMGDLVHMTLDLALQKLEADGGLANADEAQIEATVQEAAREIARVWESERAVPPEVIWRRTLDDARILTSRALTYDDERLPDAPRPSHHAHGRTIFQPNSPTKALLPHLRTMTASYLSTHATPLVVTYRCQSRLQLNSRERSGLSYGKRMRSTTALRSTAWSARP